MKDLDLLDIVDKGILGAMEEKMDRLSELLTEISQINMALTVDIKNRMGLSLPGLGHPQHIRSAIADLAQIRDRVDEMITNKEIIDSIMSRPAQEPR